MVTTSTTGARATGTARCSSLFTENLEVATMLVQRLDEFRTLNRYDWVFCNTPKSRTMWIYDSTLLNFQLLV